MTSGIQWWLRSALFVDPQKLFSLTSFIHTRKSGLGAMCYSSSPQMAKYVRLGSVEPRGSFLNVNELTATI